MDIIEIFKKTVPYWTLLNLILSVVSLLSGAILYVTNTLFPSTQSILQFTIVSILNTFFIVFWTFWFILVIPPIIGSLYLSRTEPDYYKYAVQNVIAVVILFIVKLVFGFNIIEIAI